MEPSDRQSPKAMIYSSSLIIERRKRILRETRNMIASGGLKNFSVRELCARADVAQRTLYNAFGNRENIIAQAVNEYYISFLRSVKHTKTSGSLAGRMEHLVQVHTRNVLIKPYTTAVMSVYWSESVAPAVRETIRSMASAVNAPYLAELSRTRGLRPGIDAAILNDLMIIVSYGTLSEWCAGLFPDEMLVERMANGVLSLLAGATRGAARRDVELWQAELRVKGPLWRELVEAVAHSTGEAAA